MAYSKKYHQIYWPQINRNNDHPNLIKSILLDYKIKNIILTYKFYNFIINEISTQLSFRISHNW